MLLADAERTAVGNGQGEKTGREVIIGHAISCTASGSKFEGAEDEPPQTISLYTSIINYMMKFASGFIERVKVSSAPVTKSD